MTPPAAPYAVGRFTQKRHSPKVVSRMPPPEKSHPPGPTSFEIAVPQMRDGAAMWRIARDSGALDLNSSYAYLLFCRDFADTCRVARTTDGDVVGFVLGYRRPAQPDCLFVWQVAVDERHRGHGLSSRLLDDLLTEATSSRAPDVRTLETTITEDNTASRALFASLARRHGAELMITPLFSSVDFPDDHDAEPLITIGPLDTHAHGSR